MGRILKLKQSLDRLGSHMDVFTFGGRIEVNKDDKV